MKNLIILLTLSLAFQAQAHICDDVVRAVNTDQISMTQAVALNPQALGLLPETVFSSKISNYISWKEVQKGCLADVLHRAEIEIKALKNGEICTTNLVLHRKDEFVSGDAAAVYKMGTKVEVCAAPTVDEAAVIGKCSAVQCPYVGDNPTFTDFQDNCICKDYRDAIQIKDESPNYENFYDPALAFGKPASVVDSPFTPQ